MGPTTNNPIVLYPATTLSRRGRLRADGRLVARPSCSTVEPMVSWAGGAGARLRCPVCPDSIWPCETVRIRFCHPVHHVLHDMRCGVHVHHSVTLGFARPLGRMPSFGKFCLLYVVQCENEFGACLGRYFRMRSCDGIITWSSGIDSKLRSYGGWGAQFSGKGLGRM